MSFAKPGSAEVAVVGSIEEAVLLALRSSDVKVRSAAIAKASQAADPEALVGAVGDPSNHVRRNAAIDALTRAGPRSVPTLVRALRHDDAEVVMFAATILGRTRDPSAVPHLVALLGHADVNVAQAAIESLGRLRAAAAVGPLVATLDRDPWLAFAAAHALGDIGDARAVPALAARVRDEALGDAVLVALGRIGSREALVTLAEQLLESSGDDARFAVCLRAIGAALEQNPDDHALLAIDVWAKLATGEASEVHLRMLKLLSAEEGSSTHELEEKHAVIELIRVLRLKPLYGSLVRAARNPLLRELLAFCIVSLGPEMASALALGAMSPDAGTRILACNAIGALGLTAAAAPIERLLRDRDEEVRAAAALAVARVARESCVPSLVAMLEDPSELVRIAAVGALEALDAAAVAEALASATELSERAHGLALDLMKACPHPAQRPFIRRALEDPSPAVRRAAVAAKARQPAADILDDLRPLLSDHSAEVRREAVLALGRTRSDEARDLLLRQLASDPETRTHTIRALGELGDIAVAPLLASMLDRESAPGRIAIVGALGDLRDPATEPLLVRMLADAEAEVRRSAVEALARFGTPTAVRHGLAAARDPEWPVRAAAVELLAPHDGPAALEALERLCLDESPFVARAARGHLDTKKPL